VALQIRSNKSKIAQDTRNSAVLTIKWPEEGSSSSSITRLRARSIGVHVWRGKQIRTLKKFIDKTQENEVQRECLNVEDLYSCAGLFINLRVRQRGDHPPGVSRKAANRNLAFRKTFFPSSLLISAPGPYNPEHESLPFSSTMRQINPSHRDRRHLGDPTERSCLTRD
jgi:hypothetical protein